MISKINSGTIFSILTSNAIFLASSIFLLESVRLLNCIKFSKTVFNLFLLQTLASVDISILFNIVCLICGLIWPFLLCNSATTANQAMISMNRIAYGGKWYNYPVKWRKHTFLMVTQTQKDKFFSGLSLFRCSLELFAKVSQDNIKFQFIFLKLFFSFF